MVVRSNITRNYLPNTQDVLRVQRDGLENSLYEGGHDSRCVAKGKLHTCGSRSLAVPRGVIR